MTEVKKHFYLSHLSGKNPNCRKQTCLANSASLNDSGETWSVSKPRLEDHGSSYWRGSAVTKDNLFRTRDKRFKVPPTFFLIEPKTTTDLLSFFRRRSDHTMVLVCFRICCESSDRMSIISAFKSSNSPLTRDRFIIWVWVEENLEKQTYKGIFPFQFLRQKTRKRMRFGSNLCKPLNIKK